MIETQVFLISELLLNEDSWRVRGRVYEDLRVGDSVFIEGDKTSNGSVYIEFKIINIQAFQREFQFINSGMGAQLTLEGRDTENLKKATHLLKISEVSG